MTRGGLRLKVIANDFTPERLPRFTLVQALAKADRAELALQMACELGVSNVLPWQAERSISLWDEQKAAKNLERWQSIANEAAKQSLRVWHPTVLPLVRGKELLAKLGGFDLVLVLEPTAAHPIAKIESRAGDRDIAIVVGPEGGLSEAELTGLQAAGAKPMRLGPEVLRTSTAGTAALAALSSQFGLWG